MLFTKFGNHIKVFHHSIYKVNYNKKMHSFNVMKEIFLGKLFLMAMEKIVDNYTFDVFIYLKRK